MNFARTFQAAVIAVCVATLVWIYFGTRYCRELTDDAEIATATAITPTPATPLSPSATATTADTSRPPLPKSKAEIIAALSARGYKLESFAPSQPIANVDGYRVAGLTAAVAFTEHRGKLTMVDVAAMAAGAPKNGPQLLDFAEIVGEMTTGRSRDTCRQAIAQTMAVIGKTPGRMSCSFGAGKDRFGLQVIRHDGGYSFAFTAEPPAEGAREQR